MRVLRAKSVRKHLRFYRLVFKICPPYNVVLDGNFIFTALKLKIDLRDRIEKLLQVPSGSLKFFIHSSALNELKVAGASAAYDFAKAFCEVLPVDDAAGADGAETPSQHLVKFLSTARQSVKGGARAADSSSSSSGGGSGGGATSKSFFFVATQDKDLRTAAGRIPGVPILYLNHVTLVLEAPSSASLQYNQQLETEKGGLNEDEANAVQKEVARAGQKRTAAEAEVDGRKLMYEKLAVPTTTMQIQQARKKHKAKAPHPQSMAKPTKGSQNEKKRKQKKFRKR